jgi:hypothetical protein
MPQVIREAKGKRLWFVAPPPKAWEGKDLAQYPMLLKSAGLEPRECKTFFGLEVTLYEPKPTKAARAKTPGGNRNSPPGALQCGR